MSLIVVVTIAVACYLLLEKFINIPHHAQEPSLIPQPIPYVGHLLGMLRDGSQYYAKIRKGSSQSSLPIYTLRVPRNKVYIVRSPSLAAAVDRHSKTVSFAPFVVQFARRILVPSKQGLETLTGHWKKGKADLGCRAETLYVMKNALAPGESLDRTTQDYLHSLSRLLDSVSITDNVDFFPWIKKLVTRASTDAIYGASKNPFQDPAVEAGFWAIHRDFALLGLNLFPQILAPEGHRGRKLLFQAFQKYYAQNGHTTGSSLIRARYEVNRKYGVSMEDIAHFDLSVCLGLLINTAPATAWTLFYLYSRPSLLEEVRAGMSCYIHISSDPSHGTIHEAHIPHIINASPLLLAIVQETLRVQSTNASGRIVLEDTLIENQYLLKKDSILMIPSAGLHADPSVWGPTSKDFDPSRFMPKSTPTDTRQGPKISASAYRAFGGGDSICTGKYLAANEIMIMLVIMVLKYDLSPMHEGGWVMPKTRPHITTSILTPTEEVLIRLRNRKGSENVTWKFSWI